MISAPSQHSTALTNVDTGSGSADADIIQPDPTPPAIHPNPIPQVTLPVPNPTPPAIQLNPIPPMTLPVPKPSLPAIQPNPIPSVTLPNPTPAPPVAQKEATQHCPEQVNVSNHDDTFTIWFLEN